MRNIILVIIFSFLFINKNAIASDKWGEGELQLTRGVADYFIKYLKGTSAKRPLDFYVSLDGADAIYWFCPVAAQCSPGNHKTDIQQCYKVTGKKCKKFAVRRTIKWKNGINPAKGRASTINSKWSEEEILAS